MTGLVIAAIIEYRKVLVVKEWSYMPQIPTIFGIGVSPLLQLSVGIIGILADTRNFVSKGKLLE